MKVNKGLNREFREREKLQKLYRADWAVPEWRSKFMAGDMVEHRLTEEYFIILAKNFKSDWSHQSFENDYKMFDGTYLCRNSKGLIERYYEVELKLQNPEDSRKGV